MQTIDRITIEEYKIPAMVLMERAALKVTEHIEKLMENMTNWDEKKILVVCGVGNNGGDGVAAARMLYQKGYQVDVVVIGNMTHFSEQMKIQVEIAKRLSVPFIQNPTYTNYSIIVDSLFGVGLSRNVAGEYETAICNINESKAIVVAVDLPSGVNADDGSILGVAVKADITVTFGYSKVGLIRYPGGLVAGKVLVEDIGFPEQAYELAKERYEEWLEFYTFEKDDFKLLPERKQYSHKGTFGTVLVVAGSKGMSGACYFAAKSAIRSGAGLVKVLTVDENREIIQTALPEAVVLTYTEESLKEEQRKLEYIQAVEDADSIIIGPGLGTNDLSKQILDFTLKYTRTWTILDADGINLLAREIDQKEAELRSQNIEDYSRIMWRIEYIGKNIQQKIILTPHLKEFSRLLGVSVSKINKNFVDIMKLCSYNNSLIHIIKDARTTVVQGKKCYINTSGNDGLATGGTGDTLTGIIGGLLAQGIQPMDAACLGVYAHGLTSEVYKENHYSGSMIASDVIDMIQDVFMQR